MCTWRLVFSIEELKLCPYIDLYSVTTSLPAHSYNSSLNTSLHVYIYEQLQFFLKIEIFLSIASSMVPVKNVPLLMIGLIRFFSGICFRV